MAREIGFHNVAYNSKSIAIFEGKPFTSTQDLFQYLTLTKNFSTTMANKIITDLPPLTEEEVLEALVAQQVPEAEIDALFGRPVPIWHRIKSLFGK